MDNRNERHFGEPKKLNTKIKHHLLTNTLKTSLYIANSLCIKYKEKKIADDIYTYIDLFAGSGVFDDGSKGSPILAADVLSEHINSGKSNFGQIQHVCTEKDSESYKSLAELINNYPNKSISFYHGQGSWESYKDDIGALLKKSGWGFIFADPFSTELDIESLKRTLKDYSNLKDILVFFNFNTLARQDGRRCLQDIDRICKTLGINEEELLDSDDNFSVIFENKLKEHFKDLKKFVIGVGFPTTVKGELINSDYFYLIFSTNTPVLVDSFLEAYEEMLAEHTEYKGMQQLSLFGNPDENYIYDVLKEQFKDGCSLFELYKYITDKFLSWKELTKTVKKVPTLKNVIGILNKFQAQGDIKIIADSKFKYKQNSKNWCKDDLKYNEAKNSAENLKSITIKLNR